MQLYLSAASTERLEAVAKRLDMTTSRVADALLRAVDPESLDEAVRYVLAGDTQALMVWRNA